MRPIRFGCLAISARTVPVVIFRRGIQGLRKTRLSARITLRAVTDRYRFTYLRFPLRQTNDFTSPLGIRREAGVHPGANPYLSAVASRDAGSFNLLRIKESPVLDNAPDLFRICDCSQPDWR